MPLGQSDHRQPAIRIYRPFATAMGDFYRCSQSISAMATLFVPLLEPSLVV